jgi:hypothetical protein
MGRFIPSVLHRIAHAPCTWNTKLAFRGRRADPRFVLPTRDRGASQKASWSHAGMSPSQGPSKSGRDIYISTSSDRDDKLPIWFPASMRFCSRLTAGQAQRLASNSDVLRIAYNVRRRVCHQPKGSSIKGQFGEKFLLTAFSLFVSFNPRRVPDEDSCRVPHSLWTRFDDG